MTRSFGVILFFQFLVVKCAVIWSSDFARFGPIANASTRPAAAFGLQQFGGDNSMHTWSVNDKGDFCVVSQDSNVHLVPNVPDIPPTRGFFNVTFRRNHRDPAAVNFQVANWTVIRLDDQYRCIGSSCAEGRDDHVAWLLPHIADTVFSIGASWTDIPTTLADLQYTLNSSRITASRPANATQLRGSVAPWRWACRWSCNICIVSMVLHDQPFSIIPLPLPSPSSSITMSLTFPPTPTSTSTSNPTTTSTSTTRRSLAQTPENDPTSAATTATMTTTTLMTSDVSVSMSTISNILNPNSTFDMSTLSLAANSTASDSAVVQDSNADSSIGLIIGLSIMAALVVGLIVIVAVVLLLSRSRRQKQAAQNNVELPEPSDHQQQHFASSTFSQSGSDDNTYGVLPTIGQVRDLYDRGDLISM